jgi:hypothetical protein
LRGPKGAAKTTLAGEAATSRNEGDGEFGLGEQSPGLLKLSVENGFLGRPTRGGLVVSLELALRGESHFFGHMLSPDATAGVLVDIILGESDAAWRGNDEAMIHINWLICL